MTMTRDEIAQDLATIRCPSCRDGVVESDLDKCRGCDETMCSDCSRDHVCEVDEDEHR